jgi:NADPH-dependent curcumin reductase CurA
MSDRASYAKPVALGDVMVGGVVGEVVASRSPAYAEGELVTGYGGWQEYSVHRGDAVGQMRLLKVPTGPNELPISTALGVVGMPGCTAYFGLNKLGQPKEGETLVVSAASGAVGSVVGQLGKAAGCRVVGVAGGPTKCAFCADDLGFDAAIDYKAESDLGAALDAACPNGIDIYFENVGGALAEAVAPRLNEGSRVPVCGIISQYNESEPTFPAFDRAKHPPKSRFFLVWEWPEEYEAVVDELRRRVKSGTLVYREDVVSGFDSAPEAFTRLFTGGNFGKLVVEY